MKQKKKKINLQNQRKKIDPTQNIFDSSDEQDSDKESQRTNESSDEAEKEKEKEKEKPKTKPKTKPNEKSNQQKDEKIRDVIEKSDVPSNLIESITKILASISPFVDDAVFINIFRSFIKGSYAIQAVKLKLKYLRHNNRAKYHKNSSWDISKMTQSWQEYIKGSSKDSDLTLKMDEYAEKCQKSIDVILSNYKPNEKDENAKNFANQVEENHEMSFIKYKNDEIVDGVPEQALEFCRLAKSFTDSRIHQLVEIAVFQPKQDVQVFFVLERTFYAWKAQDGSYVKKTNGEKREKAFKHETLEGALKEFSRMHQNKLNEQFGFS